MKMLLFIRKIGKVLVKFVIFFVLWLLVCECRIIFGFYWVSWKYVFVFVGDLGYMIVYIFVIFFLNLEFGRYWKFGGGGVCLFFLFWEVECYVGFFYSNIYCCRLFFFRFLYIYICKRFYLCDIYYYVDRD